MAQRLSPWRGSQVGGFEVVGIAWHGGCCHGMAYAVAMACHIGCRHGVAHRLSALHGLEVVGMALRLSPSPWHGLCVACIGMAWCSGFVRLLTL